MIGLKLPKVKVVHSKSKNAWNVVGVSIPGKYKIARVPYVSSEIEPEVSTRNNLEAREHADFIALCFNNSDNISFT